MAFGGVSTSFNVWLMGLMDDCQLWPHYEAELTERIKKAKTRPNIFQSDWELAQLFRENKSRFLQEVFEFDPLITVLVLILREKKTGNLKKEFPNNIEKLPKLEKLKAQMDIPTKMYQQLVQAGTAANSGPKRTR